MPREPRNPWERNVQSGIWYCKVCRAEFQTEDEVVDHYYAECDRRPCLYCLRALPPGSRPNRRYCNEVCKQAAYRDRLEQ